MVRPRTDGPARLTPDVQSGLADALTAALSTRYAIERELGRGGMATVFLARDLRHERLVAIKVLERDLVAPTGVDRFLNEIRIAARLTHPHILGVHDSGEADGLLHYVMPYVEGETLRSRMTREGPLPIGDAIRLVRELADALAYAHEQGVVHRDLKPENVLLSGGHAVVADFGIAKAIAAATNMGASPEPRLTATGVSLGTPAYMAPEQVVGDAATDHRADLYSLGVIAYEAILGAHPFAGRAPQALVAAHLTETPTSLVARRADTPPALDALVMKLLAKDPASRPQRAADVLRSLPDVTTPSFATPVRSRRATLAVAAALVVVVAVAGGAFWRSRNNARAAGAIHTIAVLPFVNTGGASSDDYFSDGMTDELAHALARLPGLRLAGRTSSYAFKGKAAPARDIGKTLDVAAYVGGTVRRAGDRLRVTTQLVSTADGKVLWESSYESHSTDVFAVQDEFTRAIVVALAPALSGRGVVAAGRGTTDGEAYELYLKGRYYWLARGEANVIRSIDYFKEAIARDPKFARAHAGLAMAYAVITSFVPDPKDTIPALLAASAERAVALDSTEADAQLSMGFAREDQLRFGEAASRYRAALALEPSNAPAHQALGFSLLTLGRNDDAVTEFRQATQLDPLLKSLATALELGLVFARRFPEAVAAGRQVLAIDSTYPLAFFPMSAAFALNGQVDSAVRTIEHVARLYPNAPQLPSFALFTYAAAGRWADVERIRAQLRRHGGDKSGGADAALAELLLGDREPLVRLMTTEAGQRRWHFFGCNPFLDPLWSDQRFRSAMHTLDIEPCPLARPWPFRPPSK